MKYITINPNDGARYKFDYYGSAESLAEWLSKRYHRGVEIIREPVPYVSKKIIVVL